MVTRDITTFGARTTAAEVLDGIDLTGRTALVTGAASGIGVETARALAGAGATVTLAVRDVVAGQRVADDVGTRPGGRRSTVGRLARPGRRRSPRPPLNLRRNARR
jgi:NAD(P)-dependent dehydrogenase (short-subunit alcohol dehydrogenase family)